MALLQEVMQKTRAECSKRFGSQISKKEFFVMRKIIKIFTFFALIFLGSFIPSRVNHVIVVKAEQLYYDVPENIGVYNALENFNNLVNVEYSTLAALPNQAGDFKVGKYYGLPYSQSMIDMGFVPNYVSLYTFLSALKDPFSYIYTVDLSTEGNVNGNTYYGNICSMSCLYALGINEAYFTLSWHNIPGMQLVPGQTVYNLKLGDTICTKKKGHVVMVTAIERNSEGVIEYITISEAVPPRVRKKRYSKEQFESKFPISKNNYWRYALISDVPLRKTNDVDNYEFSVIPKKGDKSNWLEGNTVELDILNQDNYSYVCVYKDGSLFGQYDICNSLPLNNLTAGNYKANLVGDQCSSNWCEWKVVDAKSFLKDDKLFFSCSNAIPLFAIWCNDKYTIEETKIITEDDKKNGFINITDVNAVLKTRVAFKTEYGVVFSHFSELITFKKKEESSIEGDGKSKNEIDVESTTESETEKATDINSDKSIKDNESTSKRILKKGELISQNGFKYRVTQTGKKVEIAKYRGTSSKIKIPESVNILGMKYTIVGIGNDAFKGNKTIKQVSISKKIKYIGDRAFAKCSSLSRFSMNDGLTNIGQKAFYQCSSLTSLVIPTNVKIIKEKAFVYCTKLKKVCIKTTKLKNKNVGRYLFKRTSSSIVFLVPKVKLKSYEKIIRQKAGIKKYTLKILDS